MERKKNEPNEINNQTTNKQNKKTSKKKDLVCDDKDDIFKQDIYDDDQPKEKKS